ncbi:MAG: hypothetical protein WC641_03745 [Patescibacteria group bacterium]
MNEIFKPEKRPESEARKLLHELEASGQYVFHGSMTPEIDELETRQPYTWISKKEKVPHGQPAVVATPYADIAIFRALVFMDSTQFGVDDHGLNFAATQKALDHAKDKVGYVYALPRSGFKPLEGDESSMDWRSPKNERPLRAVKVSFQDLPENIKLLPSSL